VADNAKQELQTVSNAWAKAFVKNDAEAIGQYMADDWVVVTPNGNVIDKASFLGMITSAQLIHEMMDFAESNIRIYGDTAIVTTRATSSGRFQGEAFSQLERSSDVFVNQNGRWKCVLTHLTQIAK